MFGKRSTVMTRGWRGSMPWRPVFNAGSVPLSPSGPSVSLSSSRLALDFLPLVPAFLSLATSVVRLFSVNSVSFPPLSLSPFPYLLLPFIHRLSPLFVLFYFPLSPFLLQLLSTIASVPLERVYCQIWGYLRIPTSLMFPRIFSSMSVQYFLRDNVDPIKARCSWNSNVFALNGDSSFTLEL